MTPPAPQPRKQTGPLDITAALTETVQTPMVECPFCHMMTRYRIETNGDMMLEFHRDENKNWTPCWDGFDFNMTHYMEAQ